jgi:hypothetical protein
MIYRVRSAAAAIAVAPLPRRFAGEGQQLQDIEIF